MHNFAVICSTFDDICCGFATMCGAYAIVCSDISIIPTFGHSISSVLSLCRVVYPVYGVQTILPHVHFALFAVLSSLCRIQAPRSLTPPFWFVFAGKSQKGVYYGSHP